MGDVEDHEIFPSRPMKSSNVTSGYSRFGKMDFDDLMFSNGNGYEPMAAYGRSKLANLLFTYELQRRFDKAGIDSYALAAHPGGAKINPSSNDSSAVSISLMAKLVFLIVNPLRQSPAMGALPTLRVAVDPETKSGEYFGLDGFMEIRGHPVRVKSHRSSPSIHDAHRLWEISEELTSVHYHWKIT